MTYHSTNQDKINKLSIKIKMFLAVPLVLLLVGCATNSKKMVDLNLHYITADSAPLNATDQNAQTDLSQSATSISTSLQQLSAIQLATHPDAKMLPPLNARAIGMSKRVTVDWNGPVEPLLTQIADAAHYRLFILGTEPTIPVLIAVNRRDETLASILRNITYQVVKKAAVNIYPNTKRIELRYKKA